MLITAAVLAALAASAPAQRRFEDFPRPAFPADGSSADVALGDVDGDGDLDVVFGQSGQNRLCLNDGAGTFIDVTATRMPADGDSTAAVALGDIDGDGDLDLVVGNYWVYGSGPAGQQNRILLNDGKGTFSDANAARMPPDSDVTNAVVLGDVDGDEDLDIPFGNGMGFRYGPAGNRNRLYLNDGSGAFTDATASLLPEDSDSTIAVALKDADGDGDLESHAGRSRLV